MNFLKCFLLTLFLIFLLSASSNLLACTKSIGESEKDKEVAKKICAIYEDIEYIEQISVQHTIMYVDISRDFFNAMKLDKLTGTKLVKRWMGEFRSESGSRVVTVWVYADKIKVIEADTSWSGEDKVKFLF